MCIKMRLQWFLKRTVTKPVTRPVCILKTTLWIPEYIDILTSRGTLIFKLMLKTLDNVNDVSEKHRPVCKIHISKMTKFVITAN